MLDPARVRDDFPSLGREVDGRPVVYLDSATSSLKPLEMIRRLAEVYSRDERRHGAFEETRAKVARLVNAGEPREIVFSRGATEALNVVAGAIGQGLGAGDEVLVTRAEHHSNIVPWLLACRRVGATVRAVPVLRDGDLDLERFEHMLGDRTRVVAVTHASNATGALFPVTAVTAMAHERRIPVVVDGAQALPHVRVDVRRIGCDFYVGSGHKMGGPSGVGFLYGRADMLERFPVAEGGATMAARVGFDDFVPKPIPQKYEPGEPAFAEVEAWGAALDYWSAIGVEPIAAYERELTRYAVALLSVIAGVRLLGSPLERVPVVSFTVDGMRARDVERALDADGIVVRAGQLEASPLLEALGTDEAVRASFMFYNTRGEVEALATALRKIIRRAG